MEKWSIRKFHAFVRNHENLTMAQIAEMVGVTKSTISNYEHGKPCSTCVQKCINDAYENIIKNSSEKWFYDVVRARVLEEKES